MTVDGEWLGQQVRRGFSAAVAAGIGAWAHEDAHVDLRNSVYEYRADGWMICLYEVGLCYRVDEFVQMWKYEDIDEILPAPLRDLVRAGGPDGSVKIGIRARGVLVMVEVPLKVCSSLCPTLLKIVERVHGDK